MENTEKSIRALAKVRLNHKTWCRKQIKGFHTNALRICSELGAWAADYYIFKVISNFLNIVEEQDTYLGNWDLRAAERKYVADALRQVEITRTSCEFPADIPLVSDKFTMLLEALLSQPPGFAGIIFAKERATVVVLAYLLSVHPQTRGIFKVGTMVSIPGPVNSFSERFKALEADLACFSTISKLSPLS
jgi:hypothetical protein